MKSIIVTDDLGFLLANEASFLYLEKFNTARVATAEEALEIYKQQGADLVILDLEQPVMGGDTLTAIIRQGDESGKTYITLICNGTKAELKRCESSGANAYLKRPLNAREVFEKVHRVLELEARRYARILIKVEVVGQHKSEPFYCVSQDISPTGILIETDKTLAKGDEIQCTFFLPDTDEISGRINAKGIVRRVAKAGGKTKAQYNFGVEFTDLPNKSVFTLASFINRHIDASPKPTS